MSIKSIKEFIQLESAGGIILIFAACLALILANSPFASIYNLFLDTKVSIVVGNFSIDKPLLLWINDGLMAIFFFLVGLEIKREILEGELSSWNKLSLPLVGAIGGIAVPAMIYFSINVSDTYAVGGWAIPAATDIAFALGIMALLGSRVPVQLKLLLLAIAIIDDLGAIVIIALFYTDQISMTALITGFIGVIGLYMLNKKQVSTLTPYVLVGTFIWVCVLKSGVHATLAGVLVAFFIPLTHPKTKQSWAEEIEHNLHPWVAFGILPIFAFANAGIMIWGMDTSTLTHPITLGIIAGLIIGKPLGIFGTIWIAVKLGITKLPDSIKWMHIYGMSVLCGIGFTMSLFISSLAFENAPYDNFIYDRVGILTASVVAALLGYFILKLACKEGPEPAQ